MKLKKNELAYVEYKTHYQKWSEIWIIFIYICTPN